MHIVQAEILLNHLQMLEQVDLPKIYSGSQNHMNSHFTRWEFMFLKYTGLQGSNGDIDIEERLVDIGGEGEVGANWESNMETYTRPYVELDGPWKFSVWRRKLKSGALW